MKKYIRVLFVFLMVSIEMVSSQEVFRWAGKSHFSDQEYLVIPASFELQHLTLSVWIKTELLGNYQTIVCKSPSGYCSQHHSPTTSNHAGEFTLMLDAQNHVYFSSQVESGAHTWGYVTQNSIPVGVWTHIVITLNKVTNTMSIYLNGQLDSQVECPSATLTQQSAEPIRIGVRKDGDFYKTNFYGMIANLTVQNGVLSAEQVAKSYNDEK